MTSGFTSGIKGKFRKKSGGVGLSLKWVSMEGDGEEKNTI